MRDFAAKQNSGSYLASENLRVETSAKARGNAKEGMEEMSERFREGGGEIYLTQRDG